ATWVRFYGTEDDDGRWEIEDGVRILMEGLPVSYQSTIEVKGDKYGRYSSYKSVHLPTRETGRLEEFEKKLNLFPIVMLGKNSVPRPVEVPGDPARNKVFLIPGDKDPVDIETVMARLREHPSNEKPKCLYLCYGEISYDLVAQPWEAAKNLALAKYGRYVSQDTFRPDLLFYERKEGKTSMMRPEYNKADFDRKSDDR
ncbi:MAG: hypothetical protein KBC95_02345, partial [Candidatus Peribacteraceae bacterium]|nr:hypothetical protein [Candidatus Peribacteraceae bacterium]